MSKTINGNIWRLDKGIKRIEWRITGLDSGIAQLKQAHAHDDTRESLLLEIDRISISNKNAFSEIKKLIRWNLLLIGVVNFLSILTVLFILP